MTKNVGFGEMALTSNVTLGKLVCPSVPHFLHLLNRDDKVPSAYGLIEVKSIITR